MVIFHALRLKIRHLMNPIDQHSSRNAFNAVAFNTTVYFVLGWICIYVGIWSKVPEWIIAGAMLLAIISPVYALFIWLTSKPRGWSNLITNRGEPRIERDTRYVTLASSLSATALTLLALLSPMSATVAVIAIAGAVVSWIFLYHLNILDSLDDTF